MALPEFNDQGELPHGVHPATLEEVCARFAAGTPQREAVAGRLRRIYQVANDTGKLQRFIIFGSFVTAKPEPNDVDVVLVMRDDFKETACEGETGLLFTHGRAAAEFGASVFWVRPMHLLAVNTDDFVAQWQIKRDKTFRGIVEVRT